jgi:hypothetical protein
LPSKQSLSLKHGAKAEPQAQNGWTALSLAIKGTITSRLFYCWIVVLMLRNWQIWQFCFGIEQPTWEARKTKRKHYVAVF